MRKKILFFSLTCRPYIFKVNILSHIFSIIWILSTETLKTSYFLLWLKPSNDWYVEYLAVFGLHYGRCTLFLAIIKTGKKIISAEITSQASHFAAGKENKPQCTISVSKPFIVDVLFLQWLFNYTIFLFFFYFFTRHTQSALFSLSSIYPKLSHFPAK